MITIIIVLMIMIMIVVMIIMTKLSSSSSARYVQDMTVARRTLKSTTAVLVASAQYLQT